MNLKRIIPGGICVLLAATLPLVLFWYTVNANGTVQTNEGYIGSKACKKCHEGKYATWVKTTHSKSFEEVTKDHNPVVPQWRGELTFKEGKIPEVTIKLEKTPDGIHKATLVDAADPTKEATFTVSRTSGGHGWKQRFYTQIGNDFYMLPMDWNQRTQQWTPFTLWMWWKSNGALRERPPKFISFGAMCAGCHQTGVVTTLGFTGYQSSISSESVIGCEKCHGPGAAHKADDPEFKHIINPAKLPFERQVEVCGQCHSFGKSAPLGILSRYPMKEFGGEMYRPGEPLSDYFKPKPILWEGTPFAKKHRQQFSDFRLSRHYSEKIGCIGCHDPHGSELKFNLKAPVENNELCLSCHQEKPEFKDEAKIAAHTKHPINSETKDIMTCVSCHQQKATYSAVMGDGTSHHFRIVSPEVSLKMFYRFKNEKPLPDFCDQGKVGHNSLALCYSREIIPNSCNGCHTDWKDSREGYQAGVTAFLEMYPE